MGSPPSDRLPAPVPPVSARPARRFALAATLTVAAAFVTAPPIAAAQVTPAAPVGAADGGVAPGAVDGVPVAPRDRPRTPGQRRRELTEISWYLFFVTAGALALLVVAAWGFGWYKRSFLADESPLEKELFDATARAEIERHRREVEAERAAAEAAGEDEEGETDDGETPAETLAEQTAPAPDPAAQPAPADDRPADDAADR